MQTPGNALFFMQLFFFRMHYLFGMHMRVLEGRLIKHLSRGIQSTKNPSERKNGSHRFFELIEDMEGSIDLTKRIKSYFRRCGKKPLSLKDMLKEIGESSSKVFSTAPCYKNIRCCRLLALARGNITELLCRRIDPQDLAKMSFSSCHRCTSGHEKP